MRWRDENPEELDRLRKAVRAWRDQNPDGTEDEMVEALAGQFRADYEPVLRAILFRAILFRADLRDTGVRVGSGITIIAGEADR